MNTYRIIIPAYIQEIEAKDEKEALEQFWFNYDIAQEDENWGNPTIKLVKTDTRNS